MMETYFDLNDAWMIPFQLQTARLNGLQEKTIVGLGIGKESPDLGGNPWTQTKEELDQQLRPWVARTRRVSRSACGIPAKAVESGRRDDWTSRPAPWQSACCLPILPGKKWHGWTGTEVMDVDAPACEVFNFKDSRYAAR